MRCGLFNGHLFARLCLPEPQWDSSLFLRSKMHLHFIQRIVQTLLIPILSYENALFLTEPHLNTASTVCLCVQRSGLLQIQLPPPHMRSNTSSTCHKTCSSHRVNEQPKRPKRPVMALKVQYNYTGAVTRSMTDVWDL